MSQSKDLYLITNPFQFVEACKPVIEAELERIISDVPTWQTANQIPRIMRYAIFAGGGGKRIRPALTLLCARCIGAPLASVLELAAAVELIHTYTLIIDDIQDGDELRRGETATHVKFGLNLALLAASMLFLEGTTRLQDGLSIPSKTLRQILHKLHAGQEADLESENWVRSQRNHESMEFVFAGKTGSLFELACIAGFASQRSNDNFDGFALIGAQMGILFQAVDDLLEITGSEAQTGKAVGKNRGQKLTFMSMFSDIHLAKTAINERKIQLEATIGRVLPNANTELLTAFSAALADRVR